MEKQNKLAVMPMPKLVLDMGIPLMFSLLVQSLYNIVDSIFVSRISEEALTATSIAYPLQMIMIAVSVGTTVGINACLSKALGAKKSDEARMITANGLFLAVMSWLVFLITGFILVRPFVSIYADKGSALYDMSCSYLSICMILSGGIFFSKTFQRFLQSIGFAQWSMVTMVTGAVMNIVLDPILIFACGLGVKGAAIATVIAQWSGAFVGLLLFLKKTPELVPDLHGFRPNKKIIGRIYHVGLPTIITQAMSSVMLSAFNRMLLPYSSAAVAFFGVYHKLQNFLFMPINGLGQAEIPIIAYNYGAKNKDRVSQVFRTTIPMACFAALIGTVIFMIFPKTLLGFFAAGDEMLSLGLPALRIISVSFVLSAVTVILSYAASGLGNGWINMISAFLRQFIILVPASRLLIKIFDVSACWYGFWIAEIITAVFCIIAVRKEFRKKLQ